jgi:hypothetical protein
LKKNEKKALFYLKGLSLLLFLLNSYSLSSF